jgi:hypothetical protein
VPAQSLLVSSAARLARRVRRALVRVGRFLARFTPRPSRWGLGRAVAASLIALVVSTAAVSAAAWLMLGKPSPPHTLRASEYFDVVKIVLAVVAGLGASVGLTVSYRRQRGEEAGAFTSRYTAAAEQLGHEKAAVRLAGVYALARLADEWAPQRQTCIDVLCAYVRMPYDPEKSKVLYALPTGPPSGDAANKKVA